MVGEDGLTRRKSNRLINVAHTRKYLLDLSEQYRNSKFSRVSAETFTYLEAKLMKICEELVRAHPSKGTTIFPPYTTTKPREQE